MSPLPYRQLAQSLRSIALKAGEAILAVYEQEFDIHEKQDNSPVTEADLAAERIIIDALREVAPETTIVAEESVAKGETIENPGRRFWLVDPLDGTKEFISRNGEFTVNIALIEDGSPVLGVVYAPAKGELYLGTPDGASEEIMHDGAWHDPMPIRVRPAPDNGLTVIASRSHRTPETDDYLAALKIKELISAGSSLKFCRIAAGMADIYPRLGRTMEWDVAAGHAVLKAAGGTVETLEGEPFTYGKGPVFENPFFVAKGRL